MAIADGSTEFALQELGGRGNSFEIEAELKVATVQYVSDTAEQGTINMVRLPAGKIRVYTSLSRYRTSNDFVTNADGHIGYAAYTNSAGTAVAADDNAFADNIDVGAAAQEATWPLPAQTTAHYVDFDSQKGITITFMVDTANMSVNATIDLMVVYAKVV